MRLSAVLAAVLVLSPSGVPAWAQPATPSTATTELRSALLAADDARVEGAAHRDVVLRALRDASPETVVLALRAVARTQRREFLDQAIAALAQPSIDVRREAAFAVAHIGSGSPDALGPSADALRAAIAREQDALVFGALVEEYGRLPFADAPALDAAAQLVWDALVARASSPDLPATVRLSVARAAEAMARRAVRLKVTPSVVRGLLSMLSERLEVAGSAPRPDPVGLRTRRLALSGLLALSSPDAAAVTLALQAPDAQTRRLGVLALARRDALDESQTLALLKDESVLVRHAVTARLGVKVPAVARAALADAHVHVRLAALQALGEAKACRDACTARLAELRTLGTAWHEPASALVALARTDAATAAPFVTRAADGSPWQLRMYAARAAALTRQRDVLERLARDPDVNVRHAALVAWREAGLPDLAEVAIAALASDDGQLLLEAATALRATPSEGRVPSTAVPALRDALRRVTALQRETSRDPRVAMVHAIGVLARDPRPLLESYLTDFDPMVAEHAAAVINGRLAADAARVVARPRPLPRAAVPTWEAVTRLDGASVVLTFSGNRAITLRLFARNAPTAVVRLVTQVQAGEWNGRTFHRVEPGFVIQGGSPAANEYAGAAAFARDEFSPLSHVRGTVGISTRGADTGDGQIFVNLVDNTRLDYGFTLVGAVTSDPALLDDVLEGEVIVSAEVRVRETPR